MTIADLARACEAALLSPWSKESDHFTRLSREAVPKLLAFVQAWDAYAGWNAGRIGGNGDDHFAKVEAARKALEE